MHSEILNQGAMPHSRAVVSSRSRVFGVNPRATTDALELIGTISSFGISSNRTIEPIRGIGLGDHIVEMVPGNSDPVELSVTKFLMSMANTFQEFGYDGGTDGFVRALKHHRYPVDIRHEILISTLASKRGLAARTPVAETYTPASQSAPPSQAYANKAFIGSDDLAKYKAIITWFEGCWFSSYSVTYPSDGAAITEDSTLMVTDVSGHQNGTILIPFDAAVFDKAQSRIWL